MEIHKVVDLKMSEKDLLDWLVELGGKKIFSILNKYEVEIDSNWYQEHYEWEEELYLATKVVEKIPQKTLIEELEKYYNKLTRMAVSQKLREYINKRINIGDLQEWEVKLTKRFYEVEDLDENEDSFVKEIMHEIDFSDIDGFDKEQAQKAVELLETETKSGDLIKEFDSFNKDFFKNLHEISSSRLACACCGNKTINERDKCEICPICYWEDMITENDIPYSGGGANTVSLILAQENFERFGACRREMRIYNRPKNAIRDVKDKDFRPLEKKYEETLDEYRKLNYPEPIITNEYDKLGMLMHHEDWIATMIYSIIYEDYNWCKQRGFSASTSEENIQEIKIELLEFDKTLEKVNGLDLNTSEYPNRKKEVITYFESVRRWVQSFLDKETERQYKIGEE